MNAFLGQYGGKRVPQGVNLEPFVRKPAIARAASFFASNLGWTLEELSPADDLHQWAVLRTSEVLDARPFDYYVDF